MDIKELSKEMTKEEFLKSKYVDYDCPGDYGLKEFEEECHGGSTCKACWSEAIKDIKFTEEEEIVETGKIYFLCTKDFYMRDGKREFTLGKTYSAKSIYSDKIDFIDDSGSQHTMSADNVKSYFTRIEKLDTGVVFSTLAKNPNLKYKRLNDGLILSIKNGSYTWESGYKFLAPDDKWMLVQDQEVEFTEAVKAYDKGKNIYSVRGADIIYYNHTCKIGNDLEDTSGRAINPDEIIKGKWFIKA